MGVAAQRTAGWRVAFTMGAYHLVFCLGFLMYAPVLAWRMVLNPSYRRGIRERMGWVPRSTTGRPVVWIHGVSVGELKAAGTLIERLQRDYPGVELVVSSTTPTGHSLALELHPQHRVIYYPLDFGRFPGRALDRVQPACVLLMELEVWPNFLQAAARREIPVAVVNGRMSEQSFRGYRLVRGFLPQFNQILRFCVQDDSYRRRLLALDVEADRIFVTGNIKYDSVMLKDPTAESARLRSWLSPDGRHVLVCGSTHGEEDLRVARLARDVAEELGVPIRVVLAPRHPERSAGVREGLAGAQMRSVAWSSVAADLLPLDDDDIVVVDTIGHLENFYGAGDVAFVGGSLVQRGGQNMLEPAALGKAVVFGPNVANFRTDVSLLLAADAAVQVSDYAALSRMLARLFRDAGRRRELGDHAIALIKSNKGATERTLRLLRPVLEPALGGKSTAG